MAPKVVDREVRRSALLAAAATVFAKFGYQRATVEQIAEAAGVAKGSVYLSFSSKEDLFYALFEDVIGEAIGKADSLLPQERIDAVAQVETLITSMAETIEANDIIVPLTLEFWSVCGVEQTRDRFGKKSAKLFAELRQRIVSILQAGQARGEVARDVPLTEIASCLMSMIDGLLVQQWTDPRIEMSKTIEAALPVFLSALKGDVDD